MESAAVLRSFHGALQSVTHAQFLLEKPAVVPVCRFASTRHLSFQVSMQCQRFVSSMSPRKRSLLSHVKALEKTSSLASDGQLASTITDGELASTVTDAKPSESTPQEIVQKKKTQKTTFPSGVEKLILEVCDETEIAELKVKVGDFEMHLKRDTGTSGAVTPVAPIASPAAAPPIPSEPMVDAGPTALAAPKKSTSAAASPFANPCSSKTSKLAVLEASGLKRYVSVSSPMVGWFRRGRTVKGKTLPPICHEGAMIKERQIIGFVDQLGTEIPIRSTVTGEVLKFLVQEGERIGFGDPLIAVLPSFHGIEFLD